MPYVLGIDVGSGRTRAAISRRTPTGWSDPVVVGLGARHPGVPTAVCLGANRSVAVGDEAERQAVTDPGRIARGFARRIGDDVPVLLDGLPCNAQELTAVLIRWVADRVAEHEGGPAERVIVAHPAEWGPYRIGLLHHGLDRQELAGLTLVFEPVAVAAGYRAHVPAGGLLATYAIGATTVEAALLRKTEDGFELVEHRSGSPDLAGIAFDDAIMDCVRAQVGSVLDQLDPTEPQAWLALAGLRQSATGAKELLSIEPEVVVPVGLPDGQIDVRVSRTDFERIIRPAIETGLDLLTRVTRSAAADLTAVVLTGGSARIPLVARLIGELTESSRARLVVGADPDSTVAIGATATARRMLAGTGRVPTHTTSHAHTEVIERSAIEHYGGGFDPVAIDDEFGEVPPPRPPLDVLPLDLPEHGLLRRLRIPPLVLTVSTLAVIAVGVVLTFLLESGSGNHQSPNSPLHLGPAADQSVQSTKSP